MVDHSQIFLPLDIIQNLRISCGKIWGAVLLKIELGNSLHRLSVLIKVPEFASKK